MKAMLIVVTIAIGLGALLTTTGEEGRPKRTLEQRQARREMLTVHSNGETALAALGF